MPVLDIWLTICLCRYCAGVKVFGYVHKGWLSEKVILIQPNVSFLLFHQVNGNIHLFVLLK